MIFFYFEIGGSHLSEGAG